MIRVLLVDDQRLVRAGLRMLCDSAPDVETVGEASNGHEAVRAVDEHRPDVVLMDLRMPGMDGTTATARILARHRDARIVVVTTFDDDEHLYGALAVGAYGFLLKDSAPDDLLNAVRRAAAGEPPFSPTVLRRVISRATDRHQAPTTTLPPLTPRERDVLVLLAQGLGNADIARHLHLGVTTVKTHVGSLLAKTGADNRVRLALLAHEADVR
ncbi:response regulator transcription factor [Umezawaea sp. Da 62-37]|uniref:response regulator transcription factor n=1 Tax=Umezawaea sp. Da 62-37 TaxID=3075927 RepID=UPI0028F7151C|nr:response regulator transcription factor [Umezawaea sp. Da 62-37]WNV85883.1 response regulator transcription factor [Umezawaea sp. Da 62-37]